MSYKCLMHASNRLIPADTVLSDWPGRVRTECLDWLLIFSMRHLERVLGGLTFVITTDSDLTMRCNFKHRISKSSR